MRKGIARVRDRVLRPGTTRPPVNSVRDYICDAFRGSSTVRAAVEKLATTLRPARNSAGFQRDPDRYIMWHVSTMIRLGMLVEVPPIKRPKVVL